MAGLRVIISHPAKQVISFNRALAAERMGADTTFLTGIYFKPNKFPYSLIRWLPPAKRASFQEFLNNRRIDGLSDSNVVSLLGSGALLEVVRRKTRLISRLGWWRAWDRMASLWLRWKIPAGNNNRTILHVFVDSCLESLRIARSKGMIRLVEVTLPPLLASEEQLDRWGVTRGEFPDVSALRDEVTEADFVLVQSQFGADTVEALGVSRERIFQIQLGIDTDYFVPSSAERRPGPIRVLFVGAISRRKGVHHLLQAWKELSLPNAELLLAGNHLQLVAKILLAEAEDVPNCRMLGHVVRKDLLSLYQQADILVHPSLAEGGCAGIQEALACGVPCVVSSHSTSAVRTGVEGIVTPPGDVRALKAAIAILCNDETLRKQMSIAARKRAVETLSLDSVCASSAEIYRAIVESYSQPSYAEPQEQLNR